MFYGEQNCDTSFEQGWIIPGRTPPCLCCSFQEGLLLFMLLILGRTPTCLCCSFWWLLLPVYDAHSWEDFSLFMFAFFCEDSSLFMLLFMGRIVSSLFMLFILWRAPLCLCCSFWGRLLSVYVAHSGEDSSLFMLLFMGRTPPCLCCSFLGGLLPVYVAHSGEDSSLFILLILGKTPPC